MPKHTPGPWEARTFLVMGGENMRDRICHVGTSTSLGPQRSKETVANAQLIAAAPDLLEAAKLAVAYDDLLLKHQGPVTTLLAGDVEEIDSAYDAWAAAMRSALSKATA